MAFVFLFVLSLPSFLPAFFLPSLSSPSSCVLYVLTTVIELSHLPWRGEMAQITHPEYRSNVKAVFCMVRFGSVKPRMVNSLLSMRHLLLAILWRHFLLLPNPLPQKWSRHLGCRSLMSQEVAISVSPSVSLELLFLLTSPP